VGEGSEKELTTGTLLEVFGGWKGLFDGSVPTTLFLVTRFFASLNASIAIALVGGILVVVVRRLRGETLQYAFSGFFGLVIAVLIVRATGTGKGIFLPGIFLTAGMGAAFALSLLVRRPAVALGLAGVDPRYGAWRTYEPLRRACVVSTAVWAASFFVRAGVATTVYLAYGDRPQDNVMIYVVINAVKWPLIIGSALLTVALVKKAGLPAGDDVASPAGPSSL
jgi:hypothetical protein